MLGMKEFPDGFFDLAIVDPPYGGGSKDAFTKDKCGRLKRCVISAERRGGGWASKFNRGGETEHAWIKKWDVAPRPEYFEELFRVSKNQIIWGGNYFALPATRCFIIWEKPNIPEKFSMSMCEYAWTSFNENAKIFRYTSAYGNDNEIRFHPTQKPQALYAWLLSNYAKEGYKILDTHAGSASCLVACRRAGYDAWGFELDPEYYARGKQWLDSEKAQISMLDLI